MARVEGFEGGKSGITPGTLAGPVNAVGVWGDSDTGLGVFGSSTDQFAVVGHSEGSGSGVFGFSDRVLGVMGIAKRFPGVVGQSGFIDPVTQEQVGNIGVAGSSFGTGGVGVRGAGELIGTFGITVNGTAVVGEGQTNGTGVLGSSTDSFGVEGTSENRAGVRGESTNSIGVAGFGFVGVAGLQRGTGPFAWAGEFLGDVRVTGKLEKQGGGFRIDHPQNPANKYLAHSFVESDDMKNVYDGVAILDESGAASVELPSWVQELNGDYRYQLTPIGEAAPDLQRVAMVLNRVARWTHEGIHSATKR